MSTILVTGSSGRLGVSVVKVLAEHGHDVVAVDLTSVAGLPARQVQLDILQTDALRALVREVEPDGIVHLAAIAVPFSRPEPEIFAINTGLAFAVLEVALECQVGKVLFASSPTVIGYGAPGGWAPAYLPIDEDHPVAPWHGYSLSKVAIEDMVAMAVRQDRGSARFGVFRPCYVITPEEWAGAPTQQGHTVVERLDEPSLAAVALFNYVDARDAGEFVAAWLGAAESIPNGSLFFVAATDSLVREPIADALSRDVPAAGRAASALDASAAVFSTEKARLLLGWSASRSWRTEIASEQSEAAHG